jgi:hypothetical protein
MPVAPRPRVRTRRAGLRPREAREARAVEVRDARRPGADEVAAVVVQAAVPGAPGVRAAGGAGSPRGADCKLRIAWWVIALGTVAHYPSSLSPIS